MRIDKHKFMDIAHLSEAHVQQHYDDIVALAFSSEIVIFNFEQLVREMKISTFKRSNIEFSGNRVSGKFHLIHGRTLIWCPYMVILEETNLYIASF